MQVIAQQLSNPYRISEQYAIAAINDQQLMMISENSSDVVVSPVAIKILKAIQMNALTQEALTQEALTQEAIMENFYQYGNIQEVVHTLYYLEEAGYITRKKLCFTAEQSTFWSNSGYDPQALSDILLRQSVSIRPVGQVVDTEFRQACQLLHLSIADKAGLPSDIDTVFPEQVAQDSAQTNLTIVLTSDYLHADLSAINREMYHHQKSWLLVKLNGTKPLIGPLFQPGSDDAACYECLKHRLALHDQQNALYRTEKGKDASLPIPQSGHPLTRQMAANRTLLKIVDYWYHGTSGSLTNGLIQMDPLHGDESVHQLVKRPQCPSCGDPQLEQGALQPIILGKESSTVSNQGGYRTKSPEETMKLYQHHISHLTGIVPYLQTYNQLPDSPIHNFTSGKNLALQSKSMFWLNLHLRSANGGKGTTDAQAKTGALCEAIERYCVMYHGETAGIQSSYYELEKAIHPNDLMLFSDTQYANRDSTNGESTKFYSLIPDTFDQDRIRDWTPVYSLTQQCFKYLPSVYCYAQYPDGDEKNLEAYPDANGCAAGNTLEEAILQGYLELIERDAAAIWWYNRIERPAVDLTTANNPYIDEVRGYYQSIGRGIHVLDLTTDLQIPVFVAISHRLDAEEKDEILYAFGAHVSAKIALERAVVELNQLLPIVAKREDGYLTKDKVFIDWLQNARLADETYLSPAHGQPFKNINKDYPATPNESIYEAIQYCMKQTESQGMETLVLDLTQPDVGMPVAKVMVPGLRHFWRRTAPGRLYDVPVKLGWKDRAATEPELNHWSIFI